MNAICLALAILIALGLFNEATNHITPYSSPPTTATTTVQPRAHATINTQNGGTP